MRKDYCPKCKNKTLIRIHQNYFRCTDCGYTERESIEFYNKYKQTTVKQINIPQKRLKQQKRRKKKE